MLLEYLHFDSILRIFCAFDQHSEFEGHSKVDAKPGGVKPSHTLEGTLNTYNVRVHMVLEILLVHLSRMAKLACTLVVVERHREALHSMLKRSRVVRVRCS
jgi:hypothetical protein